MSEGGSLRIAAIEIGTNSTKFLNVAVKGGSYEVIEKSSIVNRLSSGMYLQGHLSTENVENTVQIIGDYIHKTVKTGSKLISIFSTSVLRDAGRDNLLVKRIKDLYNVTIEIISGEQEAYLAFKGCHSLLNSGRDGAAVLDIGGGSTELTVGNEIEIKQRFSLNIGAVRLTEMFLRSDPVSAMELNEMKLFLRQHLADNLNISGLNGLVGVGGTIKTLGTISAGIDYHREAEINGLSLAQKQVEKICQNLIAQKLDERRTVTGLNPKRADVIVAGVTILLEIMEYLDAVEIIISSKGVIEGFIEEFISKNIIIDAAAWKEGIKRV